MFLKVAVKVFSKRMLTYSIPDHIDVLECSIGRMALVPVGEKITVGVIYSNLSQPDIESEIIRPLISLFPKAISLSPYQIKMVDFMANYWHQPKSIILTSMIPQYLKSKETHVPNSIENELNKLEQNLKNDLSLGSAKLQPLTAEQNKIATAISHVASGVHVLYGVTGSGKTNIYLDLARKTIEAGKQVLWLQPEIALVTEQSNRISSFLPTYLFHSRMTAKQQWHSFLQVSSGRACVLMGSRSTLLCNLPNMGLIIVDEEHDPSYFQSTPTVFLAKNVAISTARDLKIPIVLGSATPSLESLKITGHFDVKRQQSNASEILNKNSGKTNANKAKLHILGSRYAGVTLPLLSQTKPQPSQILSNSTQQVISESIQRQEQVLLFLNLRGFTRKLICEQCSWTSQCKRCDRALILHLSSNVLSCHLCEKQYPIPIACPSCSSSSWSYKGHGTEQVAQQANFLFPSAKVLRVDSDTTKRKGALELLLAEIETGEPCIIVATQMLAKGFHFDKLNTVVMLNIDYMINDQSYRNAELMYSMIFQTAGRAGRTTPGRVIIESNNSLPMQSIRAGDYLSIANELMRKRRNDKLPPAYYMVSIKAKGKKLDEVRLHLLDIAKHFKKNPNIRSIGPASGNPEKIDLYFRQSLVLLCRSRTTLHRALETHPGLYEKKFATVRHQTIVDPYEEW